MPAPGDQPDLFESSEAGASDPIQPPDPPRLVPITWALSVTFDFARGGFRFDWSRPPRAEVVGRGLLSPGRNLEFAWWCMLEWNFMGELGAERDHCGAAPASVHALLRRIRRRYPVADEVIRIGFEPDVAMGTLKAGEFHKLDLPSGVPPLRWLARPILDFIKLIQMKSVAGLPEPQARGRVAMAHLIARRPDTEADEKIGVPPRAPGPFALRFTINVVGGFAQFEWSDRTTLATVASGKVTCTGADELTWSLQRAGSQEVIHSTHQSESIQSALEVWLSLLPVAAGGFHAQWFKFRGASSRPAHIPEVFAPDESPWPWVVDALEQMARALGQQFAGPAQVLKELDPFAAGEFLRFERRLQRREERLAAAEQQRHEAMERRAAERRQREAEKRAAARTPASPKLVTPPVPAARKQPPVPPVPVRLEIPALALQDTAFPVSNLRGYFLKERAACWWVSNQSDDLLALPHCRLLRLDYQIRSALRVLGPLRGRALLSDEVGLGKTIEAGLVLKELLTRGLVKRFLVLTVPSLVDQWEEELSDKFGLTVVTTNHAAARANAEGFWRDHPGVVASLHTLKQPAQLEVARTVKWDLLIVDEAHYLRNRESQAWQAVNALSRQFLLLLTATPVQNSLEELYNLITLLQPGQLPTPKEFRARFMDPKRPRQPREPEELRRLLGQIMIRNTRANAGLNLPPRRAETVLFEPAADERAFWEGWESELRRELSALSLSQSTLWGRLLLQAAGSSPAAWRSALEKFPNRAVAVAWRERAPLETSWRKKCELLPPLTRGEGGLVVFTQFLETQAALAESLQEAKIEVFVIHGGTPAAQRQPLTEEFRRRGGALLLTHSGTEGRNLQFCHRLVNFDLPWNPMEIEQRIGRLHRLGQTHPVRIYNLVQAGTLQEHLLQILQEKLNLFELVVGETGLILGERFASDEFSEEVLRRWRESDGHVAEALQSLGDELAAARDGYQEVRQLDETLFAQDYESL